MASMTDIHDRLVLNLGQEAFRKLAVDAVDKLTKVRKIDGGTAAYTEISQFP
jgi:hypothetical protein